MRSAAQQAHETRRRARKRDTRKVTLNLDPRRSGVAHNRRNDLALGLVGAPPLRGEPRSLPVLRADCSEAQRPCPHVSCKFHLYLDVKPSGNITLNFPDLEPREMRESCCLDVADAGGATLEQVGEFMNLTRERVRLVEATALRKLRESRRMPR